MAAPWRRWRPRTCSGSCGAFHVGYCARRIFHGEPIPAAPSKRHAREEGTREGECQCGRRSRGQPTSGFPAVPFGGKISSCSADRQEAPQEQQSTRSGPCGSIDTTAVCNALIDQAAGGVGQHAVFWAVAVLYAGLPVFPEDLVSAFKIQSFSRLRLRFRLRLRSRLGNEWHPARRENEQQRKIQCKGQRSHDASSPIEAAHPPLIIAYH